MYDKEKSGHNFLHQTDLIEKIERLFGKKLRIQGTIKLHAHQEKEL